MGTQSPIQSGKGNERTTAGREAPNTISSQVIWVNSLPLWFSSPKSTHKKNIRCLLRQSMKYLTSTPQYCQGPSETKETWETITTKNCKGDLTVKYEGGIWDGHLRQNHATLNKVPCVNNVNLTITMTTGSFIVTISQHLYMTLAMSSTGCLDSLHSNPVILNCSQIKSLCLKNYH